MKTLLPELSNIIVFLRTFKKNTGCIVYRTFEKLVTLKQCNLLEGAWQTEELVDGIEWYEDHRRKGNAPAQKGSPTRKGIVFIFQIIGSDNAGNHHNLQKQGHALRQGHPIIPCGMN